MNTIIKDLGIIEKRHWYEVKCFDCPDIIKVRSDRLNKICRCKSCQANERTKQAKLLASKTKNLTDTKTCTKCGLEKHVFDFHKKLLHTRSIDLYVKRVDFLKNVIIILLTIKLSMVS